MIEIQCPQCGKIFRIKPYRLERTPTPCCSKGCKVAYKRSLRSNTCYQCGKEFDNYASYQMKYCSKKCFGLANRDNNNYLWKGDDAQYRTKHHWVVRRLGKATMCESCGLTEIPEGKQRYFDWANISGEYKRDISDWQQLCRKCHGKERRLC